jgi:hypothetical protein
VKINWTSLISERTREKWYREIEEEFESVDPLESWEVLRGTILAKVRKFMKLKPRTLDTRV